jgi:hypothetical protein
MIFADGGEIDGGDKTPGADDVSFDIDPTNKLKQDKDLLAKAVEGDVGTFWLFYIYWETLRAVQPVAIISK